MIEPTNVVVRPKQFTYQTFEEKQTDVNLALSIFEGGILNLYDVALVFTGDSDIAPSIHKVKKYKKHKTFVSILPYKGKGRVIARVCNTSKHLTAEILEKCFLPNEVEINGKKYKNPHNKKTSQ